MTIVVTGGAGRIGSAIVRLLCERGHAVIVQYYQSEHQARSLQEQWPDLVSLYRCDLLDSLAVQDFLEFLCGWEKIDGLINNAGLFERNPLIDTWCSEKVQHHLQLNTVVPLQLSHALRQLLTSSKGAIVNIVDNVSGTRPWPNHAGYAASKAGLLAVTRSLAVEMAPFVRVNAVGPGLVLVSEQDSPEWQHLQAKIPMGRWGTPQEVAETVLFLLLGPAYITGQLLCVDGGWGLSS